ncbi:hypothetical protein C8Q74DRAFT_1224088 [Fomes fomentarius]|nr:hypothetical protein C8Q74DRAFT_1224088 [Fomes fomentarius]
MERSPDPQHLVFAPNGKPVQFYLWGTNEPHSDWGLSAGQREKLTQQIEENGGELCNDVPKVGTVIVHERGHAALKERYALVKHRYAEMPTFVKKCIKKRKYEHETQVIVKPMGGRAPGTSRQEYTPEDDKHLVEYLAMAIPDPNQGGRSGNRVWQQLVACDQPELEWASRHTWQSWRNRYKKQQVPFDALIAKEVKRNPPPKDGKGRFEYDRRVNKRDMQDFWEAQEQTKDDDEGYNEFDRESGDDRAQDAPAPFKRRRTDPGSGSDDEEFEEIGRQEFDGPRNSRDAAPAVPSPPPQPQPQAPVAANHRKKGPAPRSVVRPSKPNPAASQMQTSGPMSSQATLVDLVPTQMRNAPPSQQQAEAGPGPRTVALRKHRRDAKKREEEEDSDDGKGQDQEGASIEEQPASATVLQTNDERSVEDILDLTDDTPDPDQSSRELDTDDERTRRSILPSNAAVAGRAVPLLDGHDEEEFARTYATMIQTSRHSTSSHESAVPLPYTRASAEKRKQLAYVPPPDTRAAAAAAAVVSATSAAARQTQGAAERRISGKVLRSRIVPRQR